MRKYVHSILCLAAVLAFCGQSLADVHLGGYVETDNRLRLQGGKNFTWNENRLGLKLEGEPSEGAHFYGELGIKGLGFPDVSQSPDLMRKDKSRVMPWALEFKEAYVDFYGLLFENLDVRIGRQRIVWGTADKINPTDNLNPDDLEDPLDFGRKLGTNALKTTCYVGDYTLTGVYIPVITPAVLPPPDWAFTSGDAPWRNEG